MSVATFEGYVENGQIRLPAGSHLPEKARVCVVLLDSFDVAMPNKTVHVRSPRLVDPNQAALLRKTMTVEPR